MPTLELKAKKFATLAHQGQFRKYGRRRYIYHPACVVKYLKGKDYSSEALLAAAWLHDCLEDTNSTYLQLECLFGLDVSKLVQEVSHPAGITSVNPRSKRWQAYLEHYTNASHEGKVLKLADRYCNLVEYVRYWSAVPAKGRKFINEVYLVESVDLIDNMIDVDKSIIRDLVYISNGLDELLSEEF